MTTQVLPQGTILVPVDKAVVPRDGECVTDRWWIVADEHLILWRGFAAQCNRQQAIAESIRAKMYPDAEVRHFDAVFLGGVHEDGRYMIRDWSEVSD